MEEVHDLQRNIKQNEDLLQQYYKYNMLNDLYRILQETQTVDSIRLSLDNKENLSNTETNLLVNEQTVDLVKETKCDNKTDSSNELNESTENKDLMKNGINSNVNQKTDEFSYSERTSDGENKWKCLTCFQVFDKRYALRKHYKTEHYTNEVVCSNYDNSNFFVITTSGEALKYKCAICDKIFNSKKHVTRHFVSHVEERPFVCNICGKNLFPMS